MTTYKSNNALYGRAWRITVTPKDKFTGDYKAGDAIVLSDSDWGTSALHCQFDVSSAYKDVNYGDVTIYNLSKSMVSQLVVEGAKVIIEAGYENGAYGQIWNAKVFHFIEHRENVTDRILTMHCIQGGDAFQDALVSANVTSGQTLAGRMEYITNQYQIPVKISDTMKEKASTTVREETVFGDFMTYARENAKTWSLQCITTADNKFTMTDVTKAVSQNEEIEISPETGLIGTPSQIPLGVSFKVLLDPRIRHEEPAQQIRIRNSEIIAAMQTIGDPPPMSTIDGRYKVISVRHYGDTRGHNWYTECEARVDPLTVANLGMISKK